MADQWIPPYVSDFARAHGVDLSKVGSTGEQMTLLDVAAHAKQRGDGDLWAQALIAQQEWNEKSTTGPTRSALAGRRVQPGEIDVMARNPLVDRVRAMARMSGAPMPAGPVPTLFAAGDTPAWTASGIPADSLLQVPWQARHALAAAPTQAEAYQIMQECTLGIPDEHISAAGAAELYGDHPANADYGARVQQWQAPPVTEAQLDAEFDAAWPQLAKLESEQAAQAARRRR